MLPLEGLTSTALFSPDRAYRYTLVRVWDPSKPRLNVVMLNPSTADEVQLDPTVTRVLTRARRDGFGQLVVTNLFALRSTDPTALGKHPDPVGPCNDAHLVEEAHFADRVLVAWGSDRMAKDRGAQVLALLKDLDLWCLGRTTNGSPGHPLYIAYTRPMVRYG